MNLSEYLKDKVPEYVVFFMSWGMILIFMSAFHVPLQLMVICSVIAFMTGIFSVLHDYFRKKTFYDDILGKFDELDKKYLISEMISEPEFTEGLILLDILRTATKSTADEVSEYRRENMEFREFIELWVHEVKLPLSSLQLMIHNNKTENSSRALEQLRRIDGFTDTVLYYARSENAEKDYIIKEVSLKRAVSNIAVKNREDLILHDIYLKTDSLNVTVMTDGKWLEFILGQLISNSIKYVKQNENHVIEIKAEETKNAVKLHFSDNGIGIPESDLPYIFEKSFTGENGRTHAKSTGMGLYIVKNLCDKLGHKIEVNSVQGSFTEFTVTFGKNDFYKI